MVAHGPRLGQFPDHPCACRVQDGIKWHKPSLGLVPFNGSTANNIILDAGDVDGNRGIYLDPHESNASRRFKLFGGMNASGNATACSWAVRSLVTAVSRNGINWTDWKNVSEMNVAADTLNLVLWDSQLGRYLAFTRRHW